MNNNIVVRKVESSDGWSIYNSLMVKHYRYQIKTLSNKIMNFMNIMPIFSPQNRENIS